MKAHFWVITSNDNLGRIWGGVDLSPLLRRLTYYLEFRDNGMRLKNKGSPTCDHGHGHGDERVILNAAHPSEVEPIVHVPATEPDSQRSPDPEFVIGSNPPGWEVTWITD